MRVHCSSPRKGMLEYSDNEGACLQVKEKRIMQREFATRVRQRRLLSDTSCHAAPACGKSLTLLVSANNDGVCITQTSLESAKKTTKGRGAVLTG
mmetsp:Transcript_53833/g.87142  ORF Transcript_53833/g.87142 Transcript_53833/m.87142 type:complete len:95 (-) Transcript_53833:119-403(-)